MKTTVITKNYIEGFHCYPDAPEMVDFLRYKHRHVFCIECGFQVTDSDREIEIFMQQFQIGEYFAHRFGRPAQFGNMSCEMIAEGVIEAFNHCIYVKVLEDKEGGAIVQR
jgi:Zn ribbon nucleic-acid-binding protein